MKIPNFKNYSGCLYIEIPTDRIIKNLDLVRQLNELSISIIHRKMHITTWKFDEVTNASKAVTIIELIPDLEFKLLGENDVEFIVREN